MLEYNTEVTHMTANTVPLVRRLSPAFGVGGLKLLTLDRRPDAAIWQGETAFLLKDFFTTRDGRWDNYDVSDPFTCPPWAREAYNHLPWGAPGFFDDAGAATHLFGAVLDAQGQFKRAWAMLYWSTGEAILADINAHANDFSQILTKESNGWANISIEHNSWYDPYTGQKGPWCWTPLGLSDVVVGGGLPMSWHVSMFAVWQEVPRVALVPVEPPVVVEPPLLLDLSGVVAELRGVSQELAHLTASLRQAYRLDP